MQSMYQKIQHKFHLENSTQMTKTLSLKYFDNDFFGGHSWDVRDFEFWQI